MKKVMFSALVAVVAVTGALASISALRVVSVWGTFNASGACPNQTQSIACNPTTTDNPICTDAGGSTLYTQASGRCNVPLFFD